MQSPEVKQTAVKSVADLYNAVIVKDLFKHHAEKDAEQRRCQKTTLFHTIDDGEGSREVTVQPNLARLVFLHLANNAVKPWGAAKALQDHQQSLSAYCVKRFRQTNKHYIQSFVLLHAFLLELSEDEHQVCGARLGSEPTLSFWLMVFSYGGYQSV